jgi:UTP--glucose-1-phosphate uridylyltransferase
MLTQIRQAIIPAAGLGTRFLPITKTVPKELLPLAEKPCLEHVIDEAIAAGVEEFIIVISPEKERLIHYFKPNSQLDEWLLKRGKREIHDAIKIMEGKAKYTFVYQNEPLGLGHAVLCAKDAITDDHFFVILPDDVIDAEVPVCQQMADLFFEAKNPLIAVMQVDWDQVHAFGIVQGAPLSDKLALIENIIEKPKREVAPSNLAIIGRYLLPKTIFSILEKTKPGAGGEIQLTDALRELIQEQPVHSYFFSGDRYDTGNPLGLLQASLILALKNPALSSRLIPFLKDIAASY